MNDLILGEGGNDALSGGAGDDIVYGGSGTDQFVFQANHARDILPDFTDGTELIRIWAPGVVSSFADITVSAYGAGTQLDFAGTVVILSNVDPSLISAADFIIA